MSASAARCSRPRRSRSAVATASARLDGTGNDDGAAREGGRGLAAGEPSDARSGSAGCRSAAASSGVRGEVLGRSVGELSPWPSRSAWYEMSELLWPSSFSRFTISLSCPPAAMRKVLKVPLAPSFSFWKAAEWSAVVATSDTWRGVFCLVKGGAVGGGTGLVGGGCAGAVRGGKPSLSRGDGGRVRPSRGSTVPSIKRDLPRARTTPDIAPRRTEKS